VVQCFRANTTGANNTAVGTGALARKHHSMLTTQQLVKCFNRKHHRQVNTALGYSALTQTPQGLTTPPLESGLYANRPGTNNVAMGIKHWLITLLQEQNNVAIGCFQVDTRLLQVATLTQAVGYHAIGAAN
jgi:hypothetical protein